MSFLGAGSTTAEVVGKVTGVTSKKIRSDIKELESAIDSIDKAIEGYNRLAHKINRLSGRIPSAWEGEAADAFILKLNKECKTMVEMSKLLLKVRETAMRRKNKLEEQAIWHTEIHNAANTISKTISTIKIANKIF